MDVCNFCAKLNIQVCGLNPITLSIGVLFSQDFSNEESIDESGYPRAAMKKLTLRFFELGKLSWWKQYAQAQF